MKIRFRTLNTLDFTNLYYVVIFNTSGNGQEPYASSLASYTNYSFALVFGGTSITGASYRLLQVIPTGTSAGYQARSIPIQTQYVTLFNPNSSGTGIGNEFTFTFNRALLNVAFPNATPTPTASTSASPVASPSPLASASPGASPLPSPTDTATPVPVPGSTLPSGVSTLWNLNFFSTDLNFNPIDAISNNGIQDVSFLLVVDTTQNSDQVVNKPNPPPTQVTNQSAQVMSIEVINVP